MKRGQFSHRWEQWHVARERRLAQEVRERGQLEQRWEREHEVQERSGRGRRLSLARQRND